MKNMSPIDSMKGYGLVTNKARTDYEVSLDKL